MKFGEMEAICDLQNLLNHTVFRVFQVLEQKKIMNASSKNFIVYYKWGFDGSSGHTEFKQVYESPENSDASIMTTTIVPLRVTTENGKVVWNNEVPSSSR